MTGKETMQTPAYTSLAEELAGGDVVEMANLTTAQTGVPGTIFISTAMGGYGPRVKYFLQPGRSRPSFSVAITDIPSVVANSLPLRVVRQASPQVILPENCHKSMLPLTSLIMVFGTKDALVARLHAKSIPDSRTSCSLGCVAKD